MEDPRTADGVEHLQAAARELVLAARSFLNVVEEVVEDRERFAGAASGVVDLLRDGLGGVMSGSGSPLQPWERAAWQDGGATVHDPAADDTAESATDTAESATDTVEPALDTDDQEGGAAPAPGDEAEPIDDVSEGTGTKRPAPASPPGRARRSSSQAAGSAAKGTAAKGTAAKGTAAKGAAAAPRRVRRIAVD